MQASQVKRNIYSLVSTGSIDDIVVEFSGSDSTEHARSELIANGDSGLSADPRRTSAKSNLGITGAECARGRATFGFSADFLSSFTRLDIYRSLCIY
jgi:hypothetical protein